MMKFNYRIFLDAFKSLVSFNHDFRFNCQLFTVFFVAMRLLIGKTFNVINICFTGNTLNWIKIFCREVITKKLINSTFVHLSQKLRD